MNKNKIIEKQQAEMVNSRQKALNQKVSFEKLFSFIFVIVWYLSLLNYLGSNSLVIAQVMLKVFIILSVLQFIRLLLQAKSNTLQQPNYNFSKVIFMFIIGKIIELFVACCALNYFGPTLQKISKVIIYVFLAIYVFHLFLVIFSLIALTIYRPMNNEVPKLFKTIAAQKWLMSILPKNASIFGDAGERFFCFPAIIIFSILIILLITALIFQIKILFVIVCTGAALCLLPFIEMLFNFKKYFLSANIRFAYFSLMLALINLIFSLFFLNGWLRLLPFMIMFTFVIILLIVNIYKSHKGKKHGFEDYDTYARLNPIEKLNVAIRNGNMKEIKKIAANIKNVNVNPSYCNYPLIEAVEANNKEIVEFLLEKGADINIINVGKGENALHVAIRRGFTDMAKFLLEKGAKVNAGFCPVLYYAAQKGNKEIIDLLLSKEAKVKNIYMASAIGNKKLVEKLLAEGKQINKADMCGFSALHYAVINGQEKIAEYLIENGADISQREESGGNTPLHLAVKYKQRKIVEFLLSKGADINAPNNGFDLNPPLYYAIANEDKEMAEFLISKGANVNIETGSLLKNLPYQMARAGQSEILEFLISKGAKVSDIYIAAAAGDLAAVEKFLSEGNIKPNMDRLSPLHFAVLHNKKNVVEFLLEKGYDINACSTLEKTPLDLARDKDLAQFLIKNGAKSGKDL